MVTSFHLCPKTQASGLAARVSRASWGCRKPQPSGQSQGFATPNPRTVLLNWRQGIAVPYQRAMWPNDQYPGMGLPPDRRQHGRDRPAYFCWTLTQGPNRGRVVYHWVSGESYGNLLCLVSGICPSCTLPGSLPTMPLADGMLRGLGAPLVSAVLSLRHPWGPAWGSVSSSHCPGSRLIHNGGKHCMSFLLSSQARLSWATPFYTVAVWTCPTWSRATTSPSAPMWGWFASSRVQKWTWSLALFTSVPFTSAVTCASCDCSIGIWV